MTDLPRITIVTPSFNQGAFIEKTIQSVLDQCYPNLEYIIIDGGSTDNSVEIIRRYEKHLTYWISEKDRGQSHAINKGFAMASGELMGWLNSDDYFLEKALFKFAKVFMSDRSIGAIYGRGFIIDERGNTIYAPVLKEVTLESLYEWCYGNDFMQPSTLFTRRAWEDCGPLDESLHMAMDMDLWIKIRKKYEFKMIDDILSHALSHAEAKTTAFRNIMKVDTAIVVAKHGADTVARKMLEEMADELTETQAFQNYFGSNFFWKLLRRYIRSRMKQADYLL